MSSGARTGRSTSRLAPVWEMWSSSLKRYVKPTAIVFSWRTSAPASRPVRTDDPDDRTGREAGAEVLQENTIAVGFTYLFKLDDHISQTGARRDVDLPVLAPLLILLAQEVLVGVDAGPAFGLLCLGRHLNPVELALQGLLALGLRLLLLPQALLLLLQPGGVVTLPGNAVATVQFQDPSSYVVQEIAVMGDGDDRPFVLAQMVLLLQRANRVPLGRRDLSRVLLVHSRDDPEQRALAGTVQPQHPDLGPVEEAQGDIAQNLPLGRVHASHSHHGVDNLLGIVRHGFRMIRYAKTRCQKRAGTRRFSRPTPRLASGTRTSPPQRTIP